PGTGRAADRRGAHVGSGSEKAAGSRGRRGGRVPGPAQAEEGGSRGEPRTGEGGPQIRGDRPGDGTPAPRGRYGCASRPAGVHAETAAPAAHRITGRGVRRLLQ